jgi:hypothetical protein
MPRRDNALIHPPLMMYTYIVERTQIYLTKKQAAALDREAQRSGTTRSHLIREAIDARYGTSRDRAQIERVLRTTAGLWRDRAESGDAYVRRLRSGRRLRDVDRNEEQTSTDR